MTFCVASNLSSHRKPQIIGVRAKWCQLRRAWRRFFFAKSLKISRFIGVSAQSAFKEPVETPSIAIRFQRTARIIAESVDTSKYRNFYVAILRAEQYPLKIKKPAG